jgi:hypothetical protein
VPGPIGTIQLANLRRGLQDHQYLTIARRLGLTSIVDTALQAIVPCVFSEAGASVSFPETGDPAREDAPGARPRHRGGPASASELGPLSLPASAGTTTARGVMLRSAVMSLLVAVSLAAMPQRGSRSSLTAPVMFDTAEADRILSTLQVFPPDNPWNEDISGRPVDPQSDAMVRTIGRDAPLGFNLDMNFVIVPPDQPRVPVRILMYPDESDPGPFPIPDTAPIENWPLAHNEDAKALPGPGMTLAQFQREGSGDRHLIVVDPVNGRLHEFWQARRTDHGWEASQASTFDLTSNALRPERWTSATPPGRPSFRRSFATTRCRADWCATRCG